MRPAAKVRVWLVVGVCVGVSCWLWKQKGHLGKPKALRPNRKPKIRDGYGVARPWEPGYKKPPARNKIRILPKTPLFKIDTDGKPQFTKVPGYSTAKLMRMRKKEIRDKPFPCEHWPECTMRFTSKVKRHKHHLSRYHRSKTLVDRILQNKGTCNRCGEFKLDLKRHLDIEGCSQEISSLMPADGRKREHIKWDHKKFKKDNSAKIEEILAQSVRARQEMDDAMEGYL
mmetsp:Transcript_2421/g.4478  ORF Transcript_2421/g.4478 Transcript_2421/m.4478 type:complete len:228 (-) Transcript_2421:247-930(-)|eukprot:CAMPEP_0197541612 /NCGR_PEP_ID=MMETSP1318-20131121/67257_1 /TAXON_ID=552666 /ORGANISM="Partenskyella glossopodia, Strain RCC365" /LENGTH=227 /DNA_ID=CAMNT_0043100807 /DNA_START=2403 /DNA_END=3086 /DNA_ORIENTATION=+